MARRLEYKVAPQVVIHRMNGLKLYFEGFRWRVEAKTNFEAYAAYSAAATRYRIDSLEV